MSPRAAVGMCARLRDELEEIDAAEAYYRGRRVEITERLSMREWCEEVHGAVARARVAGYFAQFDPEEQQP